MDEDAKRTINEIKFSKFSLGIFKENAGDYLHGVGPKAMATCESIPDVPAPVGHIPNYVKTACFRLSTGEPKQREYWNLFQSFALSCSKFCIPSHKHYTISYYTLDGIFQNRYSGLKETLNGYAYSKAIYYNLKNHNNW